ncbi:hypothetical protein [Rhodococcus sp. KRD162]|nr:hypothetical protein [Rhodococcus sp. KRD162]
MITDTVAVSSGKFELKKYLVASDITERTPTVKLVKKLRSP